MAALESYRRLPDPPEHLLRIYTISQFSDMTLIRAEKWQSMEWRKTPLYRPELDQQINELNPNYVELVELIASEKKDKPRPTPEEIVKWLKKWPLDYIEPYDPTAAIPTDPRLAKNLSELINYICAVKTT